MAFIQVKNAGQQGVVKDLSVHELPLGVWTDAQNIRFLDGYAYQFPGHGSVYGAPLAAPQYMLPVSANNVRSWIYATAAKQYVVQNVGGVPVHTDITHATPRAGVVNAWTGCVFGGVPILNADDGKPPMYWNQNLANKFADLPAWPAGTACKALRVYKNYLIALVITRGGTTYNYMVKWSHIAESGSLPSSWDTSDPTKDAGEWDIAEGQDPIIDGSQLRDSFMVYKEGSIWRMDYIGGNDIFRFSKVLGTSGAMNRNCIAELDGFHLVLTGSDVIVHDGQSANSVLDKVTRRYLFQNIDVNARNKCFVFKNPFLNEVFICYPTIGSSSCDRAVVWNYVDKTISFRQLPNLNHAACGTVDNTLGGTWAQDSDSWNADLTAWSGPDFTPDSARVIMASGDSKLYMLDASATFDGAMPAAYLERRGLSFDAPERIKLVRSIKPRITGNVGDTVIIRIGGADDPYADPVYSITLTHTIGQTTNNDFMLSTRYLAIRFESGTAAQWRLDSYTLDVEPQGLW